jgi:hypothetical protein
MLELKNQPLRAFGKIDRLRGSVKNFLYKALWASVRKKLILDHTKLMPVFLVGMYRHGRSGYPIISSLVIQVTQIWVMKTATRYLLVTKNTIRNLGYPIIQVRVRVYPIYPIYRK